MDINAEQVSSSSQVPSNSLQDLQNEFSERKAALLKRIKEQKNANQAALAGKDSVLSDLNPQLLEFEQMTTNNEKLLAEVEELRQKLELSGEELSKEYQELEMLLERQKKLSTQVKLGLSSSDQKILENCRTKVKLYEKLTGIHWFPKSGNIAGYIGNQKNNYLKVIKKDDTGNLWEEIGKAASADWSHFLPNKENDK